jgi:hypothetical protein
MRPELVKVSKFLSLILPIIPVPGFQALSFGGGGDRLAREER